MAVQHQEDCSGWNARTESVSQLDARAEVFNIQAMLFKRLYVVEAYLEHSQTSMTQFFCKKF